MLKITKIDSFEELLKLENQWNKLVEKSYSNNIFLNFEWISNWWKHFGNNRRLFILLVKENNKILGIAPLMISSVKKFGMNLKKLEFIGMPLSDYSDFIIVEKNKEVLEKIYDYLMEHKKEWSFISLNRIPESSLTLDLSKKISISKKLFNISVSDISPSLVFGKNYDFEKNIKDKTFRRYHRNLKKNGEVHLAKCNGDKQKALRLLDIFFEQHKKRWNKTSTPSMFNDSSHKKFFKSSMLPLMQKGKANIFYLCLNQKPIAFQINFLYNNVCLNYIPTYDKDYAKYSPGMIVLIDTLEFCFLNKSKEYDFSRGGEKYKFKYANKIKKNFKISIHKNLFLYSLDYLSSKIEMKIKENEKLYNFFIKYEKKLRIF